MGERLKGEPLAAIYVTTLRRTHQTAAPLAAHLGLVPRVEPDLREVRLGDWDGGEYRIKAEEARVQRQLETECEGHRETRDKKRKMEDDLGKLRDALGGIEFDRILGRGKDQG